MAGVSKFFLRLGLSLLLAFLIGRFFFQGGSMGKILALAGSMFVLAYLFEYTKKRDKGEHDGN